MDYIIRSSVKESDIIDIVRITKESDFFSSEEVDITLELINESFLKGPEKSGYNFLILESEDTVLGFSCYGKIPCTKSSYDLYWIVVDKNQKNRGFGKLLLKKTEEMIIQLCGKKLFIETSSTALYDPTRAFYLRNDYNIVANIKDFYDINDDKILYMKDL